MNVVERFLDYVTFETTSDDTKNQCPSTNGQIILADHLVDELKSVGIEDAARDENGYVYGHIPPSVGCENQKVIGLIAHMDTSPDVSGAGVKAKIITYDGQNAPMIDEKYKGQKLIVTDHTTLLGADDKAGIAEIISACDEILKGNIRHGGISICFTPDEEIGSGADRFDIERFGADYAYTVDGGELGGIEYENFNAAAAELTVHGINTHPGTAKDKMVNAVLLLCEFISMLPPEQTPAHTQGREGFFHVSHIHGNETKAWLHMLIRDHDREKFEGRKKYLTDTVDFLKKKYGDDKFKLDMIDSYYNMKEVIEKHPEIIKRAENAMKECGIESEVTAIRGGTDGARLSFMGLPCPNLSTGGMNYHSIYEAVPVDSLLKMTEVLVKLAKAR